MILAGGERSWLLWATVAGALALRCAVRPADRRRRHAGRDLAAERVHGARGGGDGLRAREQRLIVSGMLVGASGTMLTLLMGRAMNRSIANVLFGAFGQVSATGAGRSRRRRRRHGALGDRRRRRGDARVREQGRRRARLRHGGRAGAARRARARRHPRGEGRRGDVRDPSGRRPHAGPHERAARRGERAVSAAEGDGRGERRVRADGRGARDRRERRRQPRRAQQRAAARSTACRS